MGDNHTLPDWFLNHNTILKADFDEIHPKIEIVGSSEVEAPEASDQLNEGSTKPQPSDTTKHQVSSDDFSVIRDATAATLVHNSAGLLDRTQSFVILQATAAAPLFFLDELVKALAKDIGSSLISFDVDDLEDLGLEFSLQTPADPAEGKFEKSKGKKEKWNPSHAKRWFESSSEVDKYPKDWERSQKSFSTLLDAVLKKQVAGGALDHGAASEDAQDEQTRPGDPTGPVLVHVQEVRRILVMKNGHRILGRLCDCIQQRRQNGQTIAVVLTTTDPNPDECSCARCRPGGDVDLSVIHQHTCATKGSHRLINPVNVDPAGLNHMDYISSVNTRILKWLLRERMRHVIAPEVLHPHADWGQLICKEPGQCFGQTTWDWVGFRHACLQISGRSWGKEKLEAADILLVLSRLGLHKHEQPAETNVEEPVEEVVEELKEEEEPAQPEEQSWEDRMRDLRQECNSAELNLVDYKLQSSYSQVIIDQDLKETVLHLVSSSYLGPTTPSTSQLSQARIRGVLLYGPPGTGKTHLTRSIAKESGASMLCVDGATLINKYIGETEKNIKAAFTLASKLYPCVLFIDEVDSLFYDRSMARRSWEKAAVTQFLMEMDGLVQNDKAPCVIVATNSPDSLDKAFLRHLPQKIPIGLPDMESRSKILGLLLEGEELEPLVDINSLARETDGYSGSDLRSLCAEAALIWAIEQSKKGRENGSSGEPEKMCLGLTHFAKALQRIRPSVSKKDLLDLEGFTRRFNPHAMGR
ncbi:hypothetical protein ACHAPT_012320 [Fusarium lateritium]